MPVSRQNQAFDLPILIVASWSLSHCVRVSILRYSKSGVFSDHVSSSHSDQRMFSPDPCRIR